MMQGADARSIMDSQLQMMQRNFMMNPNLQAAAGQQMVPHPQHLLQMGQPGFGGYPGMPPAGPRPPHEVMQQNQGYGMHPGQQQRPPVDAHGRPQGQDEAAGIARVVGSAAAAREAE